MDEDIGTMTIPRRPSLGWLRDLPDIRDYIPEKREVKEILGRSTPLKAAQASLVPRVDLRDWFSPVEDQGNLGSCTANAGVALVEYFQKRAFGEYLDGSRLFLYKVTRELDGSTGDTGAYLRTTMKALALFGVVPEKHWPYQVSKFDNEPPAFCYSFAGNYKATKYYRLDPYGKSPQDTLTSIKQNLAGQLPCMFGFTVYSSIPPLSDGKGEIPMPSPGDKVEGGHAIVAAGYDDNKKIGKSTGALLIRNSWGTKWGDKGYGWLPFDYVLSGLAVDFWTLVREDFTSSKLFS